VKFAFVVIRLFSHAAAEAAAAFPQSRDFHPRLLFFSFLFFHLPVVLYLSLARSLARSLFLRNRPLLLARLNGWMFSRLRALDM
jgi:hypothetical protein